MKRALFGWGLFGLTCYLLALLATLPAARLAAWLGLPASEVRGSAWAGTATLVIAGERLHNLQWRLQPVWPWQGLLGARLSAQDQGWQLDAHLRLGWHGQLEVRDALFAGPLDAPFLARRLPLPLTGQARLALSQAVWQQGLQQAQGVSLELFKPSLRLGEPLALGDLAAEFEVRDGRLEGRLRDKGGPLALEGRLQGDAAQGLGLEAKLTARPNAPATLAENLRLLPPAPDGGARLATRLPAPWLAAPQAKD